MTGRVSFAFALVLAVAASTGQASAQNCTAADFGAVVDQTARALRELNTSGQKRYQAKVDALRQKHNLSQADIDARTDGLQDERVEAFNRDVESLVAQMDVLSQTPSNKITCEKLEELKRTRDRLLTVMGQKSGYMLAKMEAEFDKPGGGGKAAPLVAAAPVRTEPTSAPTPEPVPAQKQAMAASEPKPMDLRPQPIEPKPGGDRPVTASTRPAEKGPDYAAPLPDRAPPPARIARNSSDLPPPPPMSDADRPTGLTPPPGGAGAPLPPPGMNRTEEGEGYTISEIREAGRGVFGTINAEFAGAINYAFQNFGRPNAYITGIEGGAAFVAGLRYGKGTMYRKGDGPNPIYWQGPSAGLDFGAEGGRALFLVYNMADPGAIYGRFSGVGGAAYVAGGVGLNVLGKGGMVMVPIRSGLGLRLGANLAYVKFTERQTWNPF